MTCMFYIVLLLILSTNSDVRIYYISFCLLNVDDLICAVHCNFGCYVCTNMKHASWFHLKLTFRICAQVYCIHGIKQDEMVTLDKWSQTMNVYIYTHMTHSSTCMHYYLLGIQNVGSVKFLFIIRNVAFIFDLH